MPGKTFLLLAAVFWGASALSDRVDAAPNILLIIGDDMGVETLASYGIRANPPMTAALDRLAREGVQFSNFWSQPVCSPTRATVMTGRYGFRTGVGGPLTSYPAMPEIPEKPEWAPFEPPAFRVGARRLELDRPAYLATDEFTLPMALKARQELGYRTAVIGKWHLGDLPNGWMEHPRLAGFDHHAGTMEGVVSSFFAWNKVVNGEVTGTVGYTAIDKTNDAIAWLEAQGADPWFMWFSFNLPHPPLHLPPQETWQSDYSYLDAQANPMDNPYPYFNAMIEAMDTQIGRLLASLDEDVRENTYVIFMGDNGSVIFPGHADATPFPQGQGKGTVYQGGVRAPLIVAGPGVARGVVSEALVNSTDLFSTIIEMAGMDPADVVPADVTTDSVSFLSALVDPDARPGRDWVYADFFLGNSVGRANADYAMRGERYKLLRFRGAEEFYDLQEDPFETDNLLTGALSADEVAEYQALKEQIARLRASN